MILETHLNEVLEQLLARPDKTSITKGQLIHSIDLTLLEDNPYPDALAHLRDQAKSHHVAAICVHIMHLNQFKRSATTDLATVINFPGGHQDLLVCLSDIDNALLQGANEIDYVFPYQNYLTGNRQQALNHCDVIIKNCIKLGVKSKIIIETGAFQNINTIYQMSRELIAMGCNFLKTSTGKIPQGASLPAVFAMLSAIKDSGMDCGIKISGGVKTPRQARNYAELAELMIGKKINKEWFRIGASSLLNELINEEISN